jgi:Tfp pilus assembly protein PilO
MAIPAFSQLDKRQRMMVLVGVPVAVVLALGYFSWRALNRLGPDPALPTFLHRPGGTWTDINGLKEQIAVKDAIIAREPRIRAQLAALQDEIKIADDRLPKEAEKPEIRQLIEKLARDVPATVGLVQFKGVKIIEGAAVKGQDYQPVTYQTEVNGDLNGIIKYIDSIEKNTRFMAVRSLTIKPVGVTLDVENAKVVAGLHVVNLDIVTYVYTGSQKKKAK